MRGRQTSRAYCHDATCQGLSGITATYTGDGWTDPGWWEPEECPHCGGDLFDERLEWENPMEALADELEQNGELRDDERGDVDWQEVYGVIQRELNRQRELRRRLDQEAKAREAEYQRQVAAGERQPDVLPF